MKKTLSGTIGRDHYSTELITRDHMFYGDEPQEFSGSDTGPDAYEFILAALATSTCTTLRMFADRRNIPLDAVRVDISMELKRNGETTISSIDRKLTFAGDLNDSDIEKLVAAAAGCPVSRLLCGETVMRTHLGME